MEETKVLRSENKKLLKKLNQKSKKDLIENKNDENDNPPNDISSQMQDSDLPSLLHISPARNCPSLSTDPTSSTLPLSPLLATPISYKSAASAFSTPVSPKTPPRSPSYTTPNGSGSCSAILPGITEEADNTKSIVTVQAKLQEVRDSGKKLDYESLVALLKNHPWEESHQHENNYEYEAFDYETYHDDYKETMIDEECDEPARDK